MNNHCDVTTCLKKQQDLLNLFAHCTNAEMRYAKIIELGKSLLPYPKELETQSSLVSGCQSIMYLHAWMHEGKIQFLARSEALISAGLAALLIFVYHDEPPESLLLCPPQFLDQLNIPGSLSPSRSNGLASLHKKMQKEALHFLSSKIS